MRRAPNKGRDVSIQLSTVVKRAKDQVSCNLDNEIALLNLKSALYFGLDEVGATIWQSLSEPKPAAELCRVVLDRYDVEGARCEADVLEFLTKLEEAGLIELVPAPPGT
jgi:hypothetical protein